MSVTSNSTESTDHSKGSSENDSRGINPTENITGDKRNQEIVKKTKDKCISQNVQKSHLRTFQTVDETCVKEYRERTDAQTRVSNAYVMNAQHLCCNTTDYRHTTAQSAISNTPPQIRGNTNSFYDNRHSDSHEYASVNSANSTGTVFTYPNHSVHFGCQGRRMNDDLSYFYMGQCKGIIPSKQHSVSKNKYEFFRKGFFILSALNFVYLLLNAVGLPILYTGMTTQGGVAIQDNYTCMKCNLLNKLTSEKMKDLGVIKFSDDQCCVQSVGDLLAVIIEGWPSYPDVEQNYRLINTLLTRSRSAIHLSGFVVNDRITWREAGVKQGSLSHNEHGVHVGSGGIYYVYIEIGFKKGPCHKQRRIGYRVKLKGDNGKSKILETVKKKCLIGTAIEQDFTTQTIFQVPVGEKRELFIDFDPEDDYKFILKHRVHKLVVFEI